MRVLLGPPTFLFSCLSNTCNNLIPVDMINHCNLSVLYMSCILYFPLSHLFLEVILSCNRLKTTSFFALSLQLLFSILRWHNVSKAFIFFHVALFQVQLSYS